MKIKDTYFYKTFFSLAGIMALQNLIVFSVNLADNIMLGRFSEVAMSGVSLANQIQFLLQMLVNGAANGVAVIASQYWGKRQIDPIRKVFSAGFLLASGLSLLLGAVVIAFPQQVLFLLSDETAIVQTGAVYLRIMGFSYVIFAVTNLLIALMRSVESVRIGFAVSLVALVVNIFLNYCLIFGNLGFPELGVMGAAYATVISRIAELLTAFVYVLCIDKKLKLRLKDFFSVEKVYMHDYIKTGVPIIMSGSSWGIAMTVQTAIIGRLGEAAIGANAIAAPIYQVISVLYSSSSNAAGVLIGKTVGEGDVPRVKQYSKKLQIMFVAIGLISCGILLAGKNVILSFYDVSAETAALANTFLIILSITVIGSSYEAPCLCGIVSGGGDTQFVLKNDLIFMWGMVLPLSFLSAFVFQWPIPVTFFLLKSDQITKCAVAVVKVNRYKWIRQLTHE
ncbi:MAG: MATE family efflux transporter [Clostridia bacterium]|nr:MATE family efflux transporter [Clostridia bacterium]